jgi:triacylglycerol lipase
MPDDPESKMIVLAHGILGFGAIPLLSSFANYFNGVRRHLTSRGHTVIAPSVNPVGSVFQRGQALAELILDGLPGEGPIHIIAHSMGGLDARSALSNNDGLARRVKTLVMIGTPNRGSPVADAIANPIDPLFQPLLGAIPDFLRASLEDNTGALHDLTTPMASEFDEKHKDRQGVRYIEVAGNAALDSSELLLFRLAEQIGRLTGESNDGVVAQSSALLDGDEHLDDWPVDHFGEIGWTFPFQPAELSLPFLPPPPHFARYDAIMGML